MVRLPLSKSRWAAATMSASEASFFSSRRVATPRAIEVWRYNERPWMFIKSSSEQLYCPFRSPQGALHAWFVLWCTAEYGGSAKPDIDSLGCKALVEGENLLEKEVRQAMQASRSRRLAQLPK